MGNGIVVKTNIDRFIKTKKLLKEYAKKFKSRFVPKEISRKQLNITIDDKLILGLKFAARDLEFPVYVVAEHCLQLGLQEIYLERHDEAYKQNLQRHLLRHHLLVQNLDPLDERLGQRVRRFKNAIRFLKLFEIKTDVKAQREILVRLIEELAGGGK